MRSHNYMEMITFIPYIKNTNNIYIHMYMFIYRITTLISEHDRNPLKFADTER